MKVLLKLHFDYKIFSTICIYSKDSGHGDGLSEISDDNSGKLSPEPVDEKKKLLGLKYNI